MKLVALVGEHPHDTDAIVNLLSRNFASEARFVTLLREIHGSMLDSQKTKHLLRKAYENNSPDVVIFVRDLDGFEHDRAKKLERQSYFNECNKIVDGIGLPLLNIQTIEALILADIESFNDFAKSTIETVADPMLVEKPIDVLKQNSSYTEGQCPAIFKILRLEVLVQNCRYFATFLTEFEKRLV